MSAYGVSCPLSRELHDADRRDRWNRVKWGTHSTRQYRAEIAQIPSKFVSTSGVPTPCAMYGLGRRAVYRLQGEGP